MRRCVLIMLWPKSQAAFFSFLSYHDGMESWLCRVTIPVVWVLFDSGTKEPRQIVCSTKEPEMEAKDMVFGFIDTRLGLILLGGFRVLFDCPSVYCKAGLDFLVLVVVYVFGKEDRCSVAGTLPSVYLWIHVLMSCAATTRRSQICPDKIHTQY